MKQVFDAIHKIHHPDYYKGCNFHKKHKVQYSDITREICKIYTDTYHVCIKKIQRRRVTPGHQPILTNGFGAFGQVEMVYF